MKQYRVIAASGALLGLVLMKMAFPDLSPALRQRLFPKLSDESESIAAFRTLGQRLSLRGEEAETAPPAPEKPKDAAEAPFISYFIEEGTALTVPAAEPAPTETPLPAAVTAFLERQAAFADQTLPENVDYAYVTLPFDYQSPVAGYESSGFGFRLHPILNIVRFHFGTDFAANAGESIVAFADGVVTFAGSDDSFGKHLKIDHGNGWVSHYCHCSRLLVNQGETVTMGQQIALVGATGLATGPHLHFELSRDGVFLNPEYYINV